MSISWHDLKDRRGKLGSLRVVFGWRNEAFREKKQRKLVSQPPLPAQESTEGPASPHCRADGGCGQHHQLQRVGVHGAGNVCARGQVNGSSGCGWRLGIGCGGVGRSVLGSSSLGGRQSCLHLQADLASLLPPCSTSTQPPGQASAHTLPGFPLTRGAGKGLQAHWPHGMCPYCPPRHAL